jgi:hypothetical protein
LSTLTRRRKRNASARIEAPGHYFTTLAHLPLPEPTTRERTAGEVLALLVGAEPLR